jgi:hypothetical protein
VAILEVAGRQPVCWPNILEVTNQVKGRLGPQLPAALRLAWNSWLTLASAPIRLVRELKNVVVDMITVQPGGAFGNRLFFHFCDLCTNCHLQKNHRMSSHMCWQRRVCYYTVLWTVFCEKIFFKLTDTDTNPDPALFVSDLQDAKPIFFFLIF